VLYEEERQKQASVGDIRDCSEEIQGRKTSVERSCLEKGKIGLCLDRHALKNNVPFNHERSLMCVKMGCFPLLGKVEAISRMAQRLK
jgi:hypothetical protein